MTNGSTLNLRKLYIFWILSVATDTNRTVMINTCTTVEGWSQSPLDACVSPDRLSL